MGWEIERRFLVRVAPATWSRLGAGTSLRQGYVRNGEPSLRIRTGESRGNVLTTKRGRGVRREEHEVLVPEAIAQALFEAAEGREVEKTRWKIGPWELDRFSGPLEGLALLEIELEREDDALPDPPEGVTVLREVTDDPRLVSGQLAALSAPERRALVRRVYEEVSQ